MTERRSKSFALAELPPRPPARLAAPVLILCLGATLVVLLLAFHPAARYVHLLRSATPDDPLTSPVAQGVLAEQPHQRQIYPTLIRAELRRNHYEEAAELARQWHSAATSPDERVAAYSLQFEALRQAWLAEAPRSAARASRAVPLRSFLQATAPERARLSLVQTLTMAEVAQELMGSAQTAAWLPVTPPTQVGVDESLRAARLLRAANAPDRAMGWLLPHFPSVNALNVEQMTLFVQTAAQADRLDILAIHIGQLVRLTHDPKQAAALVDQLLWHARRMDRLGEAIPLVDELVSLHPALEQDRDLLMELIRAAREVRRPDLAAQWAERLMRSRDVQTRISGSIRRAVAPSDPIGASMRQLARLLVASVWQRAQTETSLRWFAQAAVPSATRLSGTSSRRTPARDSSTALRPVLPFDEEAYDLSFQAFLDNKDLGQAWRVARAAVDARPSDIRWRQRLAEVSEWSGKPQEALEQWQWLARQADLPAAWEGILRLAPGLLQSDALLLAYERRARLQPTAGHLRELIDLLRRMGESERALTLLQQRVRAQPEAWSIERLAQLQSEVGQSDAAVASWRQLQRLHGLTASQALSLTTLLIVRGELAQALELQERSPLPTAPEERRDVLTIRLELARMLGRLDSARRSQAALETSPLMRPEDTDTFYALLERQAPREAGTFALRNWQRFQRPVDLDRALYRLVEARDWSALDQLLTDPQAQTLINTQTDMLLLLAQAEQTRQRPARARAIMEKVLALAPEQATVRVAVLWWLIDAGWAGALKQQLTAWEATLAKDARQHDLLAAAHLNLSQPAIALRRYLWPRAQARQNDPIWLMTVADALEQNGQSELAWGLRQRIWLALNRQKATQPAATPDALKNMARVRLGLMAEPGDAAMSLLRELLREDASATSERSQEVQLLVAAWLQDKEQSDAARSWLWSRAAQSLRRPAWMEATQAFEQGDTASLGVLLEGDADRLALADRVQAWQRVGDIAAAQTTAFEGVENANDHEVLRRSMNDTLLAHSVQLKLSQVGRQDRVLQSRVSTVAISAPRGPRLKLSLALEQSQHRTRDETVLARGGSQRSMVVAAEQSTTTGSRRLSIGLNDGWRQWQHVAWQQQGTLDRLARYQFQAAWREPSDLSPAMRLAGWQHRLGLSLRHQLTGRDELELGLGWREFETQAGDALGQGRHAQLRFTHWWQRASPSLGLDLFSQHWRYQFADRAVDPTFNSLAPAGSSLPLRSGFFAVSGSSENGLRLHSNVDQAEQYGRAWRPYGSLALVRNNVTGWRRDVDIGVAGQLLGQDHFQLFWRRTGTGSTQTDTTRQIGFDLRIHF